ncbi:MAG TPA: hypothetical protein VIG08_15025 [Gemmatimonadales bacterium]|jgi:hypothetical protein
MLARHAATLTALLFLGVAPVASSQQTTDSLHQTTDSLQHARHHDAKMITTDTVKLHRDIAIRDSTRASLTRDQTASQADQKRIDSVKAVLANERKATPRDTAAINRNLALVKRLQSTHDQELDKSRQEKKRLDFDEKTVKRESSAALAAHHDLRADHPAASKKATAKG